MAQISRQGWASPPPELIVQYLSIQGCVDGLAKIFYDLPTADFAMGQQAEVLQMPSALAILLIAGCYIGAGLTAARMKIRAVEVVKG